MATVIKAGEAARMVQGVCKLELSDYLAEARALVEDAKRKSARMIAQAKDESVRLKEESKKAGYQDGFREGHEKGEEAGKKQAHQDAMEGFAREHELIVEDMKRAIKSINEMKMDLRIAAEHHLVEFATDVAARLACAVGERDPEAAVQNLKRAVRLVDARTDLKVRTHPRDLDALERFAESVLRESRRGSAVSIVADSSIEPGGCVVQTDRSEVDATIRTQVEELVGVLLGAESEDD